MKLKALDSFYDTPLAISEAKLIEIQAFLEAREAGLALPKAFDEKDDDGAAAAAEDDSSTPQRARGYRLVNGVALLGVDGVLAPKMNMLMYFSGGTSVQMLSSAFANAIAASDVHTVALDMSTPGGNVSLISAFAKQIFEARGSKPIIALLNPEALSAGYWIAAAADQIVMTENTASAGSIGVRMVHRDTSKAQDRAGVKTTHIYAGKFKVAGNADEPLSKEGAAYLQDQVDYLYSLFVQDVAKYRGAPVNKVLSDMAEGQIFIGQRAVDAGLVDGIESYDSVINRLSAKKPTFSRGLAMPKAVATHEAPGVEDDDAGNQATTSKAAPAAPAAPAANAAATSAADNAFAAQTRQAGREEGIQAERERVLSILANAPAGYEANALEAIEGGISASDFSMQTLREMKERGVNVGAMRADSPNVPFAAAPARDAHGDERIDAAAIYAARRARH
jgi:signal peptide peptidase SppA